MGHRRDYRPVDQPWCASRRVLFIMAMIAFGFFLLIVGITRGWAQFNEDGPPAAIQPAPKDPSTWSPDPNIRSWFKNVRSPHGVPCCDISDGHQTTWETRPGDDRYWVPIDGVWTPVPPEAVIHNAGNPVGEAVVWYVRQGPDAVYVRCFVPAGGV